MNRSFLFFICLFFSFCSLSCSGRRQRRISLTKNPVSQRLDTNPNPVVKFKVYKKKFSHWEKSHEKLLKNIDSSYEKRRDLYYETVHCLREIHRLLPSLFRWDIQTIILRYQNMREFFLEEVINYGQKKAIQTLLKILKTDMSKLFSPHSQRILSHFSIAKH